MIPSYDVSVMGFDFQPTLEGRAVKLRPLLKSDFEALFKASSDPLIWEQLPRSKRYQRDVFEAFFKESLSLETTLVIEERKSGETVGSSRYARIDEKVGEVEIGCTFLMRRCWGGKHNSEAKCLMIAHAFRFVRSVFFVAAAANRRSCRAIEKLGAEFERELDWPPGKEVQDKSKLYRISRDSWEKRR